VRGLGQDAHRCAGVGHGKGGGESCDTGSDDDRVG
jgi:hypothetical protein